MHPEIKSQIEEMAGNYKKQVLKLGKTSAYFSAAEAEYITFDDIYFFGVLFGASFISIERIYDVENPKFDYERGRVVNEDGNEFSPDLFGKTFKLSAEMYGCSKSDVIRRWERIKSSLDRHVKDLKS